MRFLPMTIAALCCFAPGPAAQATPAVAGSGVFSAYLPGRGGEVRSEVNMYWGKDGPVVTPGEPQAEMVVRHTA